LQDRGVIIYSVPNLHAKVYVFDGLAMIGSANVSSNSATKLVEAMARLTDRNAIRSAKKFVHDLCYDELSPGTINQLQKLYKPPRFVDGMRAVGERRRHSARVALPRLFLTQLVRGGVPAGSEDAERRGFKIAKSRRKHGRTYVLQDFNWAGVAAFRRGDKVIQVVKEEDGSRLIDAPGDVIHTHRWRQGNRHVTFVYLELPKMRRTRLERVAKRLGYGAKKKLFKNGLVRNSAFAKKLLTNWSAR
jgi:NgoFVII-like restriction endonuclease